MAVQAARFPLPELCQIPSKVSYATPRATGRRPLVVAHRGGSLEGPENTLEALRLSVAGGSDWQEVDVALTADDHPVILHDDTLLRTTGVEGDLSAWKAADVLQLKAGNPQWDDEARATLAKHGITRVPDFAGKFPQARIPSLGDVLALPGSHLMLELKATTRPALMADKVVRAVDAADARSRVIIASFDREILQAVRARAPHLPRLGLAEDMPQVRAMLHDQVNIVGVDVGLVRQSAKLLPSQTALWAWTVYTEPMARQAVADGAHAVIADNPVSLVRAFADSSVAARL